MTLGWTHKREAHPGGLCPGESENHMKVLFIDTVREWYAPDQFGQTMTVGELIDLLSEFDEACPVYLRNDNGYTFGGITEDSISESDIVDSEFCEE